MSLKKKVVWLPYDFDTAIGINNEGALAFSYNLEDTDQIDGGADVYNGQQSVMWCNLRDAFGSELAAMYKNLRSTGALSYSKIEQMFEQHQNKWPEAIFNEDAYFKYLQPLINDNDGAYLSMLQGSKAEQRKWWLYNRFKYLDSKYNAGDALTDVITLRGYAKDNITVTPYADIYPAIKYGSYLVQTRGARGNSYTLVCPLDQVNDTEIYIYSASQLASIGDISGLKVGYANFANGTKLQNIKIGDSNSEYSNGNLTELYLGNNTLLQTLDVRNCPNLAQTVDLTGCTNIEEVYFDGTSVPAVQLPNGGVLNTIHLPGTVANITIRNQPNLVDLTVPDYSHVTTLWLENVGAVDEQSKTIVCDISDNARIRLLDIDWEMEGDFEFKTVFNKINTCGGLDEQGYNVNSAQLTGNVHVPLVMKSFYTSTVNKYPYVNFSADEVFNLVQAYLQNKRFSFEDDEITTIPQYIFSYSKFDNVTFNNATGVNGWAFQYADISGTASFPNVTWIGERSFNKMKVKKLSLPKLIQTTYYGIGECVIEELDLQSLTTLTQSGLRATSIEKVYLPSCTRITGGNSFFMCPDIKYIEIKGGSIEGGNGLFSNSNKLVAFIIRKSDNICTLSSSANFNGTRYAVNGTGEAYFYVPGNLISTYQSAAEWSTLYTAHPNVFRALENYTVDGTITGDFDYSLI